MSITAVHCLVLLFQQENINVGNIKNTFQSHVLVSVVGDAFRASKKEESIRGGRDLIVEALRHKVTLHFTSLLELCLFVMFNGAFFKQLSCLSSSFLLF